MGKYIENHVIWLTFGTIL